MDVCINYGGGVNSTAILAMLCKGELNYGKPIIAFNRGKHALLHRLQKGITYWGPKVRTPEHNKAISDGLRGHPSFRKGKTISEEHKYRVSEGLKRYYQRKKDELKKTKPIQK